MSIFNYKDNALISGTDYSDFINNNYGSNVIWNNLHKAKDDDGNFKAIGDVKNSSDIKTSLKSTDSNVVKGKYFSAQLTYENGSGIAEMPVQFTLGSVVENITTDENGTAKFLINTAKGTYTISYMFSQEGYTASSAQSKILVIENSESSIKASNYVAYVGVKNPFTVTLSAGGVNLAGRTVKFALNGKVYSVKTNSKGQATLNINIAKGTYKIKYSYAGEQNINPIKGSAKITVKKGMPTKIKKANSVKYYSNTKGAFKVKLTDVRGNALANKKVVFFQTHGAYVGSEHTVTAFARAGALLGEECSVLGTFSCQCAVSPSMIKARKEGKIPGHKNDNLDECLKRWKDAESHPDEKDLEAIQNFAQKMQIVAEKHIKNKI